MRVGRDMAVSILNGWSQAHAAVRVDGAVGRLAMGFTGRVVAATDTEIRLRRDDVAVELVLRLDPPIGFDFTDIQHLHDPDPALHGTITIWLSDTDQDPVDRLGIALVDPAPE